MYSLWMLYQGRALQRIVIKLLIGLPALYLQIVHSNVSSLQSLALSNTGLNGNVVVEPRCSEIPFVSGDLWKVSSKIFSYMK